MASLIRLNGKVLISRLSGNLPSWWRSAGHGMNLPGIVFSSITPTSDRPNGRCPWSIVISLSGSWKPTLAYTPEDCRHSGT